jgi:hypothetical protein
MSLTLRKQGKFGMPEQISEENVWNEEGRNNAGVRK